MTSQFLNADTIKEAVYNLCVQANTSYDSFLYSRIVDMYSSAQNQSDKIKLSNILKNIKLSADLKRPLCQDTGQVVVFVEIGTDVCLSGINLNECVNSAVQKAYIENYYRKSVVKNSLFCRDNTNTNTPAILYTDFIEGSSVNIKLMVKGAGSENYSAVKMFNPSSSKSDIFEFIKQSLITAGEKSCPPYVLGIGAGGTMDYAALLSKKAFFYNTNTVEEKNFISEMKAYLSDFSSDILDIKLCSSSTHIACLPVALTINCHCTRHAKCSITQAGIVYERANNSFINLDDDSSLAQKHVFADDITAIRALNKGENILLTGEIYTARDAAHKRIVDDFAANGTLPFDMKDKIVFYAGPCPAALNEVIGPVGPTTSSRMDKFCEFMYSHGIVATIGKGERSKAAIDAISACGGKYLSAQGGIACLLAQCVKKCEIVAYDDLGTEAIRKLYVENLPLRVEY